MKRKRKSYYSSKQKRKKLPNTSIKEEPEKIVKKEPECADIDVDVSIVHVKVEPISIDQLEIKENSYVQTKKKQETGGVEVKTECLGDCGELGVSEAVGLYRREVKKEIVTGDSVQPEVELSEACRARKMSQESLNINNFFMDLKGKKNKAKCNLCEKIVSYKRNHLKNWHVKEYSSVKSENSSSAFSSESDSPDSESDSPDSESDSTHSESSASYFPPRKLTTRPASLKKTATCTYDQIPATNSSLCVMSNDPESLTAEKTDAINKKLLNLFGNQYLAVSLVDTPEFKEFVEELNPSYKLPTQNVLSSVFIEKESAMTELALAEYVALSTDWYSDENELHIDVAVHYVNKEADLKTYALESIQCEYNDRYIVENLAEKLRKTCENYELSNKIVAIVTDNDYNMKAAVLLNQWRHIPCLAKTLNNIILNAFDKIKVIHKKIEWIIKFLKQSSKRKRLISNQGKLKEPIQILRLDDTRWQTTCALFQRVLAMRNSLQKTLGEYPKEDNLTNEDLNVLQGVTEILGMIKDVTEEMCSGRTITIGEIIYTANMLKHKCTEYMLHADWPDLARKFVRYIQKELVERYPDLEKDPFFIESTLLDPRFKNSSFPDKSNCDLACVYLKGSAGETQDTKTYGDAFIKLEKCQSHLGLMKKREASFASEVQKEMDSFFEEPLLQISANPMKWWLSRKDQYPRLYALAWPRLFIPATSVPPEQIFLESNGSVRAGDY